MHIVMMPRANREETARDRANRLCYYRDPKKQQQRNKIWRDKNKEYYSTYCKNLYKNSTELQFKQKRYQTLRRIFNGVNVSPQTIEKYNITSADIETFRAAR
jgi:methionyl-tRNA formyltransferase